MSTKYFVKIILPMKEHTCNKKSKECGYQYPALVLPLRDLCVGLSVQASKETARKLKFKLLSLRWCVC